MIINQNISIKNLLIPTLILSAALVLPAGLIQAQELGSLEVSAKNLTATVEFVRSTPCAPYTLDWGDGNVDEQAATDDICIQVIDETELEHEYETEGTYEIALTLGEETYTDEVSVPVVVPEFSLDDVATITAEWVDPDPMMADEEYYIYTITLNDGEVVTLEVAGFTTMEWRDEQFVEAGYTGDVDALLAMLEAKTEAEEPDEPIANPQTGLYQELISVLETLIDRMRQLLSLQ